MDIRHLRYFVAVAREQSFTRAAQTLHMAQPPLSRQIQQLEEELEVQLFDRSARQLRLTPAGHCFYEKTLHVLEQLEVAIEATRRIARHERERFGIAFSLMTLNGILPEVIRKFGETYPELDVNLCDLGSTEQLEALRTGRIDVGFGRVPASSDDLRSELILNEPLLIAIPSGHLFELRPEAPSLAEISNEQFILYPAAFRPSFADDILEIFKAKHLGLKTTMGANSLHSAVGMVAAGFGITLVPHSTQDLRINGVVYRTIRDADVRSPVYMSFRQRNDSSAVENLRALVSSSVRPAI